MIYGDPSTPPVWACWWRNPVLARSLYPRALPLGGEPTAADRQVLADLVHAEQRRDDQAIGVGFGDHATTQAASDATRHTDQPQ